MSDISQGDGWWIASDGKWYAPEQHPNYVAPVAPAPPQAAPQPTIIESAAPAQVQGPPTTAYQTGEGVEMLDVSQGAPPATSETSVQRGKGGRLALLGMLAIVFVGGFGFLAWRVTNSSGAGADSPDGAVQQLVDSLNEGDAIGALSIFDPEETDAWVGSFLPLVDSLEIAATDDGSAPEDAAVETYGDLIQSLSLTVTGPNGSDPTYEVEQLHERIALVTFDGLDIGFDGDANAGRALILGLGGDTAGIDLEALGDARMELRNDPGGVSVLVVAPDGSIEESEFIDNGTLSMVSIERDGQWYLSVGYTWLELARQAGELDPALRPDFGAAFSVIDNQLGAETPEGVVTEFLNASETLDYRRMRDLTDPAGLPYFHDYWRYIGANIDDGDVAEASREIGLRFDPPQVEVTEWEGRTVVNITALSGVIDGGTFSVDVARGCAVATIDGETEQGCFEEAVDEGLYEAGILSVDPRRLIPAQYGMVVDEQNGRWYLDPMATIAYHLDQVIDAVDDVAAEVTADTGMDTSADSLPTFFFVDGPRARVNEVAIAEPNDDGIAGVAIDLENSGLGTLEELTVAVIRVTPSGSAVVTGGSGFGNETNTISAPTWGVAADRTGTSDAELPAVAALTTGNLQVDVFGITPSPLVGPTSGALDGEGTPQMFSVSRDETRFIDVTGASFHVIDPWDDDEASVFSPFFEPDSFAGSNSIIVVFGSPNQSFEISLS